MIIVIVILVILVKFTCSPRLLMLLEAKHHPVISRKSPEIGGSPQFVNSIDYSLSDIPRTIR